MNHQDFRICSVFLVLNNVEVKRITPDVFMACKSHQIKLAIR